MALNSIISNSSLTNKERLQELEKQLKLDNFKSLARARKGNLIIRNVKTNPHYIIGTHIISGKNIISWITIIF